MGAGQLEPVLRDAETHPRPRLRRRFALRPSRLVGLVVPVALLGLWALEARLGWISETLLPSPGTIASALTEFFTGDRTATLPGVVPFRGAAWYHLSASLARCGVSFVAAVAVGTGLGLLLGLSRQAGMLLNPTVNALRAVPLYAWLPLALVWFGIGEGAARTLVFIGALWPVVVAVGDGVGRVPRSHIETARMLGTPRRRLWRRVYLPSALPEIVTGLRLSLTLAWMSVIVGELTGTRSGVGAMMNSARESGRTDQVIVGLLVFAVVGFVADAVLRAVSRRWIRWSVT